MISIKQITKDRPIPEEFEHWLGILVHKTNMLCEFAGFEPIVSSGYRTMEEHLEIYRRKGVTDPAKIPMHSRHLSCQAVDLYDPDQKLQKIILDNQKWFEDAGMFFEDFSYCKDWVHMQIVRYGSWKPGDSIFFKPY